MPDPKHVAKIVGAYAKRNTIAADQLSALVGTVSAALSLIEGGGLLEPSKELGPAVPIKRSVQAEAIICLDCGARQKVLKRHIMTMHKLTVGEYRRRWGLTSDYPVVAPNYAAQRRAIAKSLELGGRNRSQADQP
jgi:predicted transcriptional regulator